MGEASVASLGFIKDLRIYKAGAGNGMSWGAGSVCDIKEIPVVKSDLYTNKNIS